MISTKMMARRKKASRLPQGVTRFTKGGKVFYRFRAKGRQTHYFKAAYGTPSWQIEYDDCLKGDAAPKIEPGKDRYPPDTFNHCILHYYRAPEFTGLAETTKPNVRGILERWRLKHGHKRVRHLERRHVKDMIGAMAPTPSAANNLLDRLKVLMTFAVDAGYCKTNPLVGMRGYSIKSKGFHTWTDAEIDKFEERHPEGSEARLAMALLLYTGQRRSDIVAMGWQHMQSGRLEVTQQKTGVVLSLKVPAPLMRLIKLTSNNAPTFLVTEYGLPRTAAGFGNWFRNQCNLAGLPNCSAHGLRKAMSRRLAEAGRSNQQIKSVTGHKTDKEVSRYTAAADQRLLSDQALKGIGRVKK